MIKTPIGRKEDIFLEIDRESRKGKGRRGEERERRRVKFLSLMIMVKILNREEAEETTKPLLTSPRLTDYKN